MEQTNHTAEEEVKKWERYCYIKEYQFCTPNGGTATDGNIYEFTPKELDQYKKAVGQSYHTQRLKEIKDPTKIEEVLESEMEHRKIHDEFGFTGQYSLSNKQVLDVLITLLQNHIDDE